MEIVRKQMRDNDRENDKIKFASAIDPDFNPYSENKKSEKKTDTCKSSKDSYYLFDGITSGLQAYVAKHLTKTLNESLIRTDFPNPKHWKQQKTNEELIKLFSTSTKPCQIENDESRNDNKSKRKRKNENYSSSEDDDDEMEKFSSVAVTSEWVLKKKGVYENICREISEDETNEENEVLNKKKRKRK